MSFNEQSMQEVRAGLVQFIGAMLKSTGYEGPAARQVICASLLEEALKLINVNDAYELYSAKPILRATVLILQERKKAYEDLLGRVEDRKPVYAVIAGLRSAIKILQSIIDGAKEVPSSGSQSKRISSDA